MQNNLLRKLITLIDLTSLDASDSEETILELCRKATTSLGSVACVCIYPQFVAYAKKILQGTSVKIATVVNFPHGEDALPNVVSAIETAIHAGALEIDVVFPYNAFLAGEVDVAREFIKQCKRACGENVILKVILETGVLQDPHIIKAASREALMAGADFLKTSTGKVAVGATIDAAKVMLMTIREVSSELNRSIGFKVSGGVRTIEDAVQYIDLATQILGADWVSPKTFRIGASQLLDVIIKQ